MVNFFFMRKKSPREGGYIQRWLAALGIGNFKLHINQCMERDGNIKCHYLGTLYHDRIVIVINGTV